MNTYWAIVRTSNVGVVRVQIQADNPYDAYQLLESMYGDKLLSESAALVPTCGW